LGKYQEGIMLLEGKVAVITGAGSGIGRATALLLAQEGAKVAAIDRTPEDSQEMVSKIQQSGGEAISTIADISQADQPLAIAGGALTLCLPTLASTVSGHLLKN
jgi:NAD(P)-dependent dehydrogenase (short-subunit alcohol dehydrogenase family)